MFYLVHFDFQGIFNLKIGGDSFLSFISRKVQLTYSLARVMTMACLWVLLSRLVSMSVLSFACGKQKWISRVCLSESWGRKVPAFLSATFISLILFSSVKIACSLKRVSPSYFLVPNLQSDGCRRPHSSEDKMLQPWRQPASKLKSHSFLSCKTLWKLPFSSQHTGGCGLEEGRLWSSLGYGR